jgi:hypothetical protein
MKEFDYKRAWAELAKPAFDALPQSVRDLYERVCVEMKDIHQNRSQGLDWPSYNRKCPLRSDVTCSYLNYECDTHSLRRAFAHVPAKILFDAQSTIYFYGHWSSNGHSYKGSGGTWKFQILAKQSLIERGWIEPGGWAGSWDSNRFSRDVIDSYMVETDPKVIECDKRRAEAIERYKAVIVAPYEVVKIDGVTRPHPFCITGRHITGSEGRLDEYAMRKYPCGYCNESYDKHITEETLFIRVPSRLGGQLPDDLHAMLMVAKDISADSKVVSFAFLGPE